MIVIAASDTIAGAAPTGANEVTCTLFLMELHSGTGVETYTKDQQQLAASVATIYTATANGPTFVRAISVVNTDVSNASTFQLFVGGTAAANAVTPVFTIPAGGCAMYEDGRGWKFFTSAGALLKRSGFSQIFVQRFTTAGADTYIPTAGMKHCIAIVTGGGGGGGGADTSAGGSADVGVGAGGGAGGTAIGFFTSVQVGASKTLSIGSAGTAGSTAGGNGGAGGNSTWNTTDLVGTGGALGTGSGSTAQDAQAVAGGLGGVPTGGTVNVTGGSGDPGFAGSTDMVTVDLVFALSGKGGASFWGGGGRGAAGAQNSLTANLSTAGGAGLAYGAGGAGGFILTDTAGVAGGAGMAGAIVVVEFL